MTGAEVEVYEPPAPPASALIGGSDPDEFLRHAGTAARALVHVVKERHLSARIGGKEYIQVEAWTTLGSLLGSLPGGKSVFAVADGQPEFVEIDGVAGFRAHVKAVTIDGETVGAAWAFCMRDEPNWKSRPLHALAAMAETRATSRALRKPLGFIVELAGYSATAPEEMPSEPIEDTESILDPEGSVFPDQRDFPGAATATSPFEGPTGPRGSGGGATSKQMGFLNSLRDKLVDVHGQPATPIDEEIAKVINSKEASALIKKLQNLVRASEKAA